MTTVATCLLLVGLSACATSGADGKTVAKSAITTTAAATTTTSPTLPGDPSDYGLDDETATDDESATEAPTQTFGVGDTLELDDWRVTVTKISKPTYRQVRGWNMFNDRPKGQYVMVDYSAKYVGDERRADASFDLSWSFNGSNNQIYDEASVVTPRDDDPSEARKGGTVKQQVIFDIPIKAVRGGTVTVESDTTYAEISF